jgi:tetratricopeptide (TPR) repeat protein
MGKVKRMESVQLLRYGLLMLVTASITGCRPGVGRLDNHDRGNRMVQQGYARLNEGDYDSAILALSQALDAYPSLARPHLDLAFLLHDRRRDYVRAIYHYSRYLELRPQTEKRELIETRIQQAMRTYGALCAPGSAPGGAPRLVELEQEVETLRRQLTDMTNRLAIANEQLAGERRRADEAERIARRATQLALQRTATPAPNADEADATPPVRAAAVRDAAPSEVANTPGMRTYTVRPDDTLSRIAHKVYGDATLWPRIRDANQDMLKGSVSVKIGQVLKIPPL